MDDFADLGSMVELGDAESAPGVASQRVDAREKLLRPPPRRTGVLATNTLHYVLRAL